MACETWTHTKCVWGSESVHGSFFFVGQTVIADKVLIDLYTWLAELKVRNISGGLMDAHLQKGK